MTSRTYTGIDKQTCTISETTTNAKIINVDGIMAQRDKTVVQLAVLDEAIAAMKAEGCDFSKHEAQPE